MGYNEDYDLLQYSRKNRPTTLSTYRGNIKAVNSVMKSMKNGKRVQTILLTGYSGCGKTSLARLIEKEYLCENRDDIEGACGKCPMCLEMEKYIITGKTDDLMIDSYITEVDVGKDTSKRSVESIIEEAQYSSLGDEWRIWMFDEFHKASDSAKTAMLKFAEEPPEKVLLIFCTTERDKLPIPLLTRMRLDLEIKKPKNEDLILILKDTLSKEKVVYEERALNIIANRSNYIPRTALGLAEKIVDEKTSVTYENTLEVLEEISDKLIFDFYNLLIERNTFDYIQLLCKIKNSVDISTFVSNLISFTNRGIYIINGCNIDGMSEKELTNYKKLFSKFTVQQLSQVMQKLLDMRNDISQETKLLQLGYTGLTENRQEKDQIVRLEKVNLQEEIAIEHKKSLQTTIENNKISDNKINETIDSLTEESSSDDILSMFGGMLVD